MAVSFPLAADAVDLFSSLPKEMLHEIFEKTELAALKALSQVSKHMNKEVESYLKHKALTASPSMKDEMISKALYFELGWKKLFSIFYKPSMTLSYENYKNALWQSAASGDLEKMKSLSTTHGHDSPFCVNMAIYNACESNQIETVKWLVERFGFRDNLPFANGFIYSGTQVKADCIAIARKLGHLEILDFLNPAPQVDQTFVG